jgi:hypothetical protein
LPSFSKHCRRNMDAIYYSLGAIVTAKTRAALKAKAVMHSRSPVGGVLWLCRHSKSSSTQRRSFADADMA